MRLTIIGSGIMGNAIAHRCVAAKVARRGDIVRIDKTTRRPRLLMTPIIFLCVKPQDAVAVMREWRGKISSESVVISIMAGVRIATLRSGLRHRRIIRAMPNTPLLIGEGMTIWKATGLVNAAQKKSVRKIFHAFGTECEVHTERLLDIATAVSGSGPAYVFHFAENLIHAARGLGLSQKRAQLLVTQTILGAAMLMKESGDDPATLRNRVTSKKGTTAAAFAILEHAQLSRLYTKALRAAFKRVQELAQ